MRLIDADKIVYSWQIDADGQEHDGVTLKSIIDKIPTIETKIIYCRECKYWKKTYGDERWSVGDCDAFDKKLVMCEGFCAWAERREE